MQRHRDDEQLESPRLHWGSSREGKHTSAVETPDGGEWIWDVEWMLEVGCP